MTSPSFSNVVSKPTVPTTHDNLQDLLERLICFELADHMYTLREVTNVPDDSKANALLKVGRGKERDYLRAFTKEATCGIQGCSNAVSTVGFMTFGGCALFIVPTCATHNHIDSKSRTQIKLHQVFASFNLFETDMEEDEETGNFKLVGEMRSAFLAATDTNNVQ